jgi:hypothetical protein
LDQGQKPGRAGGDKSDRGLSAANVMLKDFINDPSHWRKRADETRDLAKRVIERSTKKIVRTRNRI